MKRRQIKLKKVTCGQTPQAVRDKNQKNKSYTEKGSVKDEIPLRQMMPEITDYEGDKVLTTIPVISTLASCTDKANEKK